MRSECGSGYLSVDRRADAVYLDGTLIVLANFLLETKEQGVPLSSADFPGWFQQHREISSVLNKSTLD